MAMKPEKATFGAGCFWGVEAAFNKVHGVVSTAVGYAGGTKADPTYKDVCTGTTGHAEVVRVDYDPSLVTYEELLEVFWSTHDPTQVDRQGPDIGSQYRSVIFFHSDEQEASARESLERHEQSGGLSGSIATEILPAPEFYKAEDYHQKYFEKSGVLKFLKGH